MFGTLLLLFCAGVLYSLSYLCVLHLETRYRDSSCREFVRGRIPSKFSADPHQFIRGDHTFGTCDPEGGDSGYYHRVSTVLNSFEPSEVFLVTEDIQNVDKIVVSAEFPHDRCKFLQFFRWVDLEIYPVNVCVDYDGNWSKFVCQGNETRRLIYDVDDTHCQRAVVQTQEPVGCIQTGANKYYRRLCIDIRNAHWERRYGNNLVALDVFYHFNHAPVDVIAQQPLQGTPTYSVAGASYTQDTGQSGMIPPISSTEPARIRELDPDTSVVGDSEQQQQTRMHTTVAHTDIAVHHQKQAVRVAGSETYQSTSTRNVASLANAEEDDDNAAQSNSKRFQIVVAMIFMLLAIMSISVL